MSEKSALILLHGVGLNQTIWAAQIRDLQANHRVVTYDLLGHGTETRRGNNLADWVAQLEEVVGSLELQKFSLVGFSFGGMIAQAYSAKHQNQIERLVLLNTVYDRSAEERAAVLARLELARRDGLQAMIAAALSRWFSPTANPELLATYETLLRGNDPAAFLAAYACFATADQELNGALAHFRQPTLVMTGELDSGSTPAMAQKLSRVISNAECYIVPGGRHMMWVETPQLVNPVLARFLNGVQA